MKNFMLLIREDISNLSDLSEEQIHADIREYMEWVEELTTSGNYVGGDPLEASGKYIKASNIESDGPFIESKEAISGYILIKAQDIDEATRLAKGCPVFKNGGLIELRPIMQY